MPIIIQMPMWGLQPMEIRISNPQKIDNDKFGPVYTVYITTLIHCEYNNHRPIVYYKNILILKDIAKNKRK